MTLNENVISILDGMTTKAAPVRRRVGQSEARGRVALARLQKMKEGAVSSFKRELVYAQV